MRRLVCLLLFAALSAPVGADAMALDWDPNSPGSIGLESRLVQQGDQLLAGGSAGAIGFTSTANDTVDKLSVFLGDATDQDATLLAEVYPSASVVPSGGVTTTIFRPNGDLQIGGVDSEQSSWVTNSLTTTNLSTRIDEATLDVTDWITYFAGSAQRYRYRFNLATAGALWPANQRVVGGRVKIVANREEVNGRLEVFYYDATVGAAYSLGTVTASQRRATLSVPWPEYNPATRLPWTRAEIQALDAGSAIQFRTIGVGKQKNLFVYQAWLELDWVTESRVAVGIATVDSTGVFYKTDGSPLGGTFDFSLQVPNTGADNWAKATATAYTILVRRIRGTGLPQWRFLAETQDAADATGRPTPGTALPVDSYIPLMDTRGFVSDLGDVIDGRAYAFTLTTTAPAVSVDGQPYAAVNTYSADSTSTSGTGQTLSVGTTGSYSLLRFVGSPAQLGESSVSVTVENVVGPTQVAQITLSREELDRLGTPLPSGSDPILGTVYDPFLYEVRFLSAFTLTAGQRYEVRFATSSTDLFAYTTALTMPVAGVSIAGLVGSDGPSFGGSTDNAAGSDQDALLTLSTQPAAPSSFAASVVSDPTGLDAGACTVDTVDRVRLGWTAFLGAGFARYEIERGESVAGDLFPGDGFSTILAIGDSITEGESASAPSKRWINLLQALLRAAYPTAGVADGGFGYTPAWYAGSFTDPAATGTAHNESQAGLGYRNAELRSGQARTFTGAHSKGTTAQVWYMTVRNSGKFSVTVDGGTPYIIDTAYPEDSFHDAYVDIPTGGAVGSAHSIVVAWVSDGSSVDFPYPRFGGIRMFDGDEPQEAPYITLAGIDTSYVSCVSRTVFDPTTTLAMTVAVDWPDYTPGTVMHLGSRWDAIFGNNRAWRFFVNTDGTLGFNWSTNGIADSGTRTSTAPSLTPGKWFLRFEFTLATGDCVFKKSSNGSSFTTISTATGSGATTIYAASARLYVGIRADIPTLPAAGKFYRATLEVNGSIVAAPQFDSGWYPHVQDGYGNLWVLEAAAFERTGGKGIQVLDAGHSGFTMANFLLGYDPFFGPIYTDLADWTRGTAPAAVILAPFINEWQTSTPVATAKARAQTVIDKLRTDDPTLPLLLVAWYEPHPAYAGSIDWADYVQAINELAVENGGAVCNFYLDPQGSTSLDRPADVPGGVVNTGTGYGLHPSDAGHSVIAAKIAETLTTALPVGYDWDLIFGPSDEATIEVSDFEGRRNTAELYRMRVVRAGDYIPSPWTAYLSATATAGTEVVIASNHAQASLGFERAPDYEWDEVDDTEIVGIIGRDGRAVLVAAEDRGQDFTLPLIVFAGSDEKPTPTTPGRVLFEPLREFCRNDVPHFAVVDADGWRWFAFLRLASATRTEDSSVYEAALEVNEVTFEPVSYDPDA